jgi:hypothetical protein
LEASSRSRVRCNGSRAICHHSSTMAMPSSPTRSRVALDKPLGLPPGLPDRPGLKPLPVMPPVLRPLF